MAPSTEADLAALLAQTETAHGAYEARELGGRRDDDWATWYAAYLLEHGLPGLLGGARPPTAADLGAVLARLDADYRRDRPPETWPAYYAQRIVSAFG